MIYYEDGRVLIRSMREEDAEAIHRANLAQGWHSELSGYKQYFSEQKNKTRFLFVAEDEGQFAGYAALRAQADAGPFAGKGIPEISDFNVYPPYRRKGIGGKILWAAEKKAAELGRTVTLGVGLHSGYGSAQRMYIKRGYLPDGSGVWYQGRRLEQYAECRNDDDLVLYFSKNI